MADPSPLSRAQIAAFVGNDPDAIRTIERLFTVAGTLTPDVVQGVLQGRVNAEAVAADLAAQAAALGILRSEVEALALGVQPPPGEAPARRLGQFASGVTQTAAVINTAYAVALDVASIAAGVRVVSGSRLTPNGPGRFRLVARLNATKSNAGTADLSAWVAINGTAVASSGVVVQVAGAGARAQIVLDRVVSLGVSDYAEVMWSVADVNISLTFIAAVAPVPAIASAAVIMEGSTGEIL